MAIDPDDVKAFFAAYGRRSDAALRQPPVEDIDGVVADFAPFFVGAGPGGVMGGANDATFRTAVAAGFARYRELGGTSFEVIAVVVQPIDDFNVMAKVEWRFSYDRAKERKKGRMDFTNVYFLNAAGGALRIFAYVTPDEEAALRQEGLVA
ncbi:MAG: hypothetical protein ACWA6X_04880 [Bauldia sp.]